MAAGVAEKMEPAKPHDYIREHGFRLRLLSDPRGVIEVPAMENTIVSIHVGPSVHVACRRGGYSHRGTAVHGDIDIIPPGTPSRWEINDKDTALVLSISPKLLQLITEESGFDSRRLEIRNRFQIRDEPLENIAWVLKAELESGFPCGRLYLDSLAVAVTARLVSCHSSEAPDSCRTRRRSSGKS